MKIIEIEIKGLYKNLEDNKLDLLLDQTAKEFLVDKGFDEKFGARPLKRAIQKFKEGTKIIAKHVEKAEELVFYDEALETESPSEEANKSDSN
jgi:ATP-dependent Clp protease ATP-binding subunit ClpC